MAALRTFATRHHVWVKLALCLLAFTAWVKWWFVPNRLVPEWERRGDVAPTRHELIAFLETLPARVAPDDLVVVFVGDSSVGGWPDPRKVLPPKLARALAERLPGRRVQLVNLTFIGLLAEDALLLVAKTFELDPDLVIYAMSPRVVPTEPPAEYAMAIRDIALEPGIVARAGLGPVMAAVGFRGLGRTLVYSYWPPARLRTELGRALLTGGDAWLPAGARDLVEALLPGPPAPDRAFLPGPAGPYVWLRAQHRIDPPTPSTYALDALIRLCAREGRCLLYHIPVNPAEVGGFEPGLVDEFAAHVAAEAARAGVPFVDFRRFGDPRHFALSRRRVPDAIHRTEEGHAAFAPVLAERVVARLGELGR